MEQNLKFLVTIKVGKTPLIKKKKKKKLNMRQQRWMKFLKNYDFELKYTPSKVNVVVDALSRKSIHVYFKMVHEVGLLEEFRDLSLYVGLRD